MSLVFIIYIVGLLDPFKFLVGVFGLGSIFAGIIGDVPLKICVKLVKVGVLTVFLAVLIPSKDTAYLMLAAEGVTEVSQNERVRELAGKSLDLLEQEIGKYLEKEVK